MLEELGWCTFFGTPQTKRVHVFTMDLTTNGSPQPKRQVVNAAVLLDQEVHASLDQKGK